MRFLLFLFVLSLSSVTAQLRTPAEEERFQKEEKKELKRFAKEADTSYIFSYNTQLVTRLYFSRKFNNLTLFNVPGSGTLRYRPNSSYNIGIGATYKGLTLNLAYGIGFLGFLNPRKDLGVTKYLDLQSHLYGRQVVIDLFGEFYQGFYLFPKGTATHGNSYYVRPDLRVNEVGVSVQYILNHRRFSYRAAFLQNEWQKKSAGTVLVGFEVYRGNVNADSSLVPSNSDVNTAAKNINQFRYFKIGPSLGYAHTLVYKKHFFLTGSLSGNLGLDYNSTRSDADGQENNFSVSPSIFYRVFAGYNSERWAVSVIYISNNVSANPGTAVFAVLNTANVRFNIVYRVAPPKKVKKQLKQVPNVDVTK